MLYRTTNPVVSPPAPKRPYTTKGSVVSPKISSGRYRHARGFLKSVQKISRGARKSFASLSNADGDGISRGRNISPASKYCSVKPLALPRTFHSRAHLSVLY